MEEEIEERLQQMVFYRAKDDARLLDLEERREKQEYAVPLPASLVRVYCPVGY